MQINELYWITISYNIESMCLLRLSSLGVSLGIGERSTYTLKNPGILLLIN